MRNYSSIGVLALGLAWGAEHPAARAQVAPRFQAPPQSVAFEDAGGKFEDFEGDVVQIRDSKSEAWWLKVNDETKVTVKGEAEEDCLRTGIFVELKGKIDKKGTLAEPVSEIEIFAIQGKPTVGLFAATEPVEALADEPKPLRNAGPGTYRIRGKLAVFRDGEIVVLAGNRKITGDVAEKLAVTVSVDDLSLAQEGDEVDVKAWYYDPNKPVPVLNRPGKALAEEITIKLAKPLAPTGKKPRAVEKPGRPATRSKSATRN